MDGCVQYARGCSEQLWCVKYTVGGAYCGSVSCSEMKERERERRGREADFYRNLCLLLGVLCSKNRCAQQTRNVNKMFSGNQSELCYLQQYSHGKSLQQCSILQPVKYREVRD